MRVTFVSLGSAKEKEKCISRRWARVSINLLPEDTPESLSARSGPGAAWWIGWTGLQLSSSHRQGYRPDRCDGAGHLFLFFFFATSHHRCLLFGVVLRSTNRSWTRTLPVLSRIMSSGKFLWPPRFSYPFFLLALFFASSFFFFPPLHKGFLCLTHQEQKKQSLPKIQSISASPQRSIVLCSPNIHPFFLHTEDILLCCIHFYPNLSI